MDICQKRGLQLFLDQSPIPVMEETKFLRLIYVEKKGLKTLDILNVIDITEWGDGQKVKHRLYRALVRSKLDYGCIVYGSARMSYLQMLDLVHTQGLRLCLGAFRTSVESLYVDAHEPSLGARRAKLSLQDACKIKSLPKHPTHNVMFDNEYTTFDAWPYLWPAH